MYKSMHPHSEKARYMGHNDDTMVTCLQCIGLLRRILSVVPHKAFCKLWLCKSGVDRANKINGSRLGHRIKMFERRYRRVKSVGQQGVPLNAPILLTPTPSTPPPLPHPHTPRYSILAGWRHYGRCNIERH